MLPAAEQLSSDPLLESARAGDGNSQLLLADAFFFGKGRQVNPTLAVYWYRKSAASGNVQAQYNLAVCLEKGWGANKSVIAAYSRYSKAAEKGLLAAVIRKAELLFTGIPDEQAGTLTVPGIAAEPEKAEALLSGLAEKHPQAAASLAEMLFRDVKNLKKNAVKIRQLLEKALRVPEPSNGTLLLLATVLQDGIGGAPDQKRAADLLEKAAMRRDPAGCVRYGLLLEHGHGRPFDPAGAIKLYRSAAEKNNARGMFELARHFKSGFYLEQDLKRAFELFSKSAAKGYPPAFAEMGDCLRYGLGTDESAEKAFDSYIRGARLSDPVSRLRAGECFQKAVGVREDPAGAVFWYRKAAELGNVEACRRLALAFLTGYGVKKDIAVGSRLLKQAAALGDTEAEKLLIKWSD